MSVACPARIGLCVEPRRGRLAGLFAKLSLCDELEIIPLRADRIELVVESEAQLPDGPANSAYRAAAAFREAFGVKLGVRIRLIKRIPIGAGLGGAASDAAGVLRRMASVFEIPVGGKVGVELMKLGRTLDPDIPFFLKKSGLCLVEGSRISPVKAAKTLPYIVVADPGFRLPRAKRPGIPASASRPHGLTRNSHIYKLMSSLEEGRSLSVWEEFLFNGLEDSGLSGAGRTAQARRILERIGLRGVRMAGTGPSVFGFAGSHDAAERAVGVLREYPWRVFLTGCNG